LVIGFIDNLQIVTTSNYSAIATSHILQLTTARTKSSQSAVFTGCRLVTAFNSLSFLSFRVHVVTGRRLSHNELTELYVTTDGQPASLSWNKAPIWGLRADLYYLCDSYGLVLVGRPL
jgi:hypothetical protein